MTIVALRTTAVAKGGEAIAREPSGRVVFVEGALPGEEIDVELVDTRADYARGRVVRLRTASPDRVAEPCPAVAAGCGGCDLQHASPRAQLALKEAIVRDALARIGRVADVPPITTVALPPGAYRTTVRGVVDHRGRFAFRRRHSHDPVAIDSCLVLNPLLDELVRDGHFGEASTVTLRCGARTGERLVIVEPTAAGVLLPSDVQVVGGDELRRGRRAWFHEIVADRRFRISARSFFQARPDGAEALVYAARDAAGAIAPGHVVVDACAGVGLFGASIAAHARIVAIERNHSSASDAQHNLASLDARVIRCAVEQWRPSPADVVLADPARDGLGRAAVDRLVATAAPRFVLISCDAAAFARDVALLRARGYELCTVTLVDLFGHTSHIEIVSRFVRRDS